MYKQDMSVLLTFFAGAVCGVTSTIFSQFSYVFLARLKERWVVEDEDIQMEGQGFRLADLAPVEVEGDPN